MDTLFNCSLWGDESFSAVLSQKSFIPMLQVVAKDTSPPLFYVISYFWIRLFGSSEIAIRSLSLLFFIGTSVLIYFIAKHLFDKRVGIIAAVLSFFNPFLFLYAFEGRMYFCLLFFVTLSFYFLVKKKKISYVLAATAALYSHHFAFFAVATQFLWQLISLEKIDKKTILSLLKQYLAIFILYTPWIYPLYLQTTLVSGGFWLGKPKLRDLLNVTGNFIKGGLKVNYQYLTSLVFLITLVARKWQRRQWKNDSLLLLWAIFPPLLTFLISQTKLSIFYERYLLYCIPPLMILIASKTRKISHLLLAVILFFYVSTSYYNFTHPFKKPFREFSSWIKKEVPKDVFIINYNGGAHHLWETKYYQISAPIYSPGGPLPFFVGTALMEPEDVIYELPNRPIIGAITSDSPQSLSISNYESYTYHQVDSLYFVWFTKKSPSSDETH